MTGDGGKCQRGSAGLGAGALRTAGLVSFRKEGRVVYYRLKDGFPARLLDETVVMLGRLAPWHGGVGMR